VPLHGDTSLFQLFRAAAGIVVSVMLVACRGFAPSPSGPSASAVDGFPSGGKPVTPIRHVLVIVQENRTPDNLFQGIPGADIAHEAIDSRDQPVPLHEVSLKTLWDLPHSHEAFLTDYDHGKMDGFDAGFSPRDYLRPFGYAPESEVAPYHEMAKRYVFADRMFQTNQGPSYPAHLYFVSGTAGDKTLAPYKVSSEAYDQAGQSVFPGCNARKGTYVDTIDPFNGAAGPHPFPCFDHPVLSEFIDAKNLSWRYYQPRRGAGRWEAMDSYSQVRYGPQYKNVIWPSQTILSDIKRGRLANLSWVIPNPLWSDHAGHIGGTQGPAWVAAIVNAIGESTYWKSTAIFVTWDDWGGWYDHVAPRIYNHYELGFRVPLVVVSAYAKRAYVSKKQHEFGSILAFIEETFGIPKGALHSTDRRADDLMDAFDFDQRPREFSKIDAPPFHPTGADTSPEDEDP
jgi:phospholipase C